MVAAATWGCGMVVWDNNCYGGLLPVSRFLSHFTCPFKLHPLIKGGGKGNSSSSRYHKMCSMQVLEKPSSLSDAAAAAVADNLPLSSSSASSYETAMDALSSLITRQRRGDKSSVAVPPPKYGKLDRMRFYLQILDLEERIAGLKIIHVAGTKGKGSTCTFCEAILRECGFRTGLFTSPHLIDVRERFRIDGLDISEDKFLVYFWDCWNRLKEHVTDDLPMPPLFQFLTVLAFKIFVSEQVDVSIIEVGLGGGNDSTNVIKEPIVCGITSLGMDHTESLGNTLGEIASHKAGIFKPQVPAFTVPQNSEAMHVLWEKANGLEVPLSIAEPLDVNRHQGLKLGLMGDYQLTNAGLALSLCKSWLQRTGNWDKIYGNEVNQEPSLPKPFLRGLSTAHLSGRAQIVYDTSSKLHLSAKAAEQSSGDLIFYLDGAHSPESMEACAKWFSSAVEGNKQSAESNLPSSHDVGSIPEIGRNGCIIQPVSVNYEQPDKIVKKILLFNCMEVRDPEVLLPRLIDTCAFSGVYFSKAIFVPSISTYRKVTSGSSAIPMDFSGKDFSWQLNLQKIWERIIHGKDVDAALNKNSKAYSLDTLPPREFLYEDVSNSSAIIPSLPLAIKWLRVCIRENPTLRVQVLVTGSLHLVGDVLKILKR